MSSPAADPDTGPGPAEDSAPTPEAKARRPRLSREVVLTAALALVDAEGLEALSMRRLGNELGRDPMGLYRYARNRADLQVPHSRITRQLDHDWLTDPAGPHCFTLDRCQELQA